MRKYLLLMGICAISSLAVTQTNYEITELGNSYSTQQIEESINAADLCGFYYINNRRILHFDDGAVVELLMQNEAISLQAACFILKQPNVNDYDNTWKISTSGHLMRVIAINPTK